MGWVVFIGTRIAPGSYASRRFVLYWYAFGEWLLLRHFRPAELFRLPEQMFEPISLTHSAIASNGEFIAFTPGAAVRPRGAAIRPRPDSRSMVNFPRACRADLISARPGLLVVLCVRDLDCSVPAQHIKVERLALT
jgi:hypothetical protein